MATIAASSLGRKTADKLAKLHRASKEAKNVVLPTGKKDGSKNTGNEKESKTPTTTTPDAKKQQMVQLKHEQEEDDLHRQDTLYETTSLQDYVSRRIEPEDLKEIKRLLTEADAEFFKYDNPNLLFEKCCFNLVMSDKIETDRIVAAAFFDDKPLNPDLKKFAKTWKKTPRLKKMVPLNTLYLHLLAKTSEVPSEILLTQVVAFTFIACTSIEYIIVECPTTKNKGPFLFNKMIKSHNINPSGRQKKTIIVYDKGELFPSLRVREGRENDLDDLAPLLPMSSETLLKEFGKGYLTDVIATGDKNNQSVVAEWNYEAVGICLVTTDINYELLNSLYHLEPFHGLHKPFHKDEVDVYCYDTKNVVDIPIDEMMQEARFTMNELRGRTRRREPPEIVPYTVEAEREEILAEYESDESAQVKSDELHRQGHQFGVSVSEDVIQYGLRSPSPLNSLGDDENAARLEQIKLITEQMRGQGEEEEEGEGKEDEDEDEDEEEEEEEEEEDDTEDLYTRPSMNVLLDGGDDKRDAEPTALTLMDFIDEFIVDDERNEEDAEKMKAASKAEDERRREIENEEVEGEVDPYNMEHQGEYAEELGEDAIIVIKRRSNEMEGEGYEEVSGEESWVSYGSSDTNSTETDSEPAIKPPSDVSLNIDEGLVIKIADENQGEYEGEFEGEFEGEGYEEMEEYNSATTFGDGDKKRSGRKSGRGRNTGKSRLWQTSRSTGYRGTNRGTGFSSGMGMSMMGSLPGQNLDFFQNKTEFQRRWSDDTIYLGKTGIDRLFTFDDKIELMKKVWEVYSYMKEEGLTFEAVKVYLSPEDLSAIEEADILTKGNLLKFLTLLLPDETMYPFHRYIKPKVPKYYGLPNGVAIKLFNMEKKFSLRTTDLLREVFKFFPNREYLVVTVPQGSKEPAWLDNFVRVVPRIDCSYPNELFVVHRAYLTSKLKVRRARVSDIPSVIRLLESLKQKLQILNDFKLAVCCKRYAAFLVQVLNHPNNPIVGLAIVSDEKESQTYQINYHLENHTYYGLQNQNEHAYMHHFIMYPIFQPFARTFTKEVMRILNKTCIYQRIFPSFCKNETSNHQSLLNNMDTYMPVTPRKRIHYSFLNLTNDSYDLERVPPPYVTNYDDPFAVIYFGKKFAYDQKINMNSRVVFVGASDTTLACIEKMICSSFRAYKRLTIVDKFGLPGQLEPDPARDTMFNLNKGGTSMSFKSNFEWVQRLGLQHWANIVVGTVTRINREKKFVVVCQNCQDRIIPYDVLVLAPGRQFVRLDCPEPEIDDPNFLAFKKKSNRHKMQGQLDLTFKKNIPKPKNVFTLNSEVEGDIALRFIKNYSPFMKRKKLLIFGAGFRCFSVIKGLLLSGIPANRIVLIDTPNFEVEWEAKVGYNITNTVRIPMEEELKALGVHWVQNYEFSEWETCPISGLVKRTYFSSPTEKESRISFSTFVLFCFRHRRVNDDLVSALAEAYLLFQDGIIIDEKFKTNDPDIYAAGPATTYKRILMAGHHDHMYYQSEEIAQKLAEFIIDRVGSEGGGLADIQTLEVLKFKRPFVRAVELMGGWNYMVMRAPGAPHHTRCLDPTAKCDSEEACMCTTEIVTGSVDKKEDIHQKYFKLQLDNQSRVVSIECMSRRAFSASNFIGLYGQHEVLLNKMMERLEKGETKDLYSHFCQPWFGAFCVDHWESFLSELHHLYRTQEIEGGHKIADFILDYAANLDNPEAIQVDPNIIRNVWSSSGLKQEVELKFLSFLKFNKLSIPMYAHNDYVEDLLEERSSSTLYHPKVVKNLHIV